MSVFMLTCMYVHCVRAEYMGMRKGHGVSEKWSGESTGDHYIFKPIKILTVHSMETYHRGDSQ